MVKKTLLSIASTFLIWQSYLLISTLHISELNSWGEILFIAWLINLFITGIFAFAGFAFPTQNLIPKSYYQIYDSGKLKKIYKLLRVNDFRKMLLATFWRNQNQREKYFNGKKSGIRNFTMQSMKSEFGHLIPFIIINMVCIYLIAIGLIRLGVLTLLINLIGNMYYSLGCFLVFQ